MPEFSYINYLPEGGYPSPRRMVVVENNILCIEGTERVIFEEAELSHLLLPDEDYFVGLYDGVPCYVTALETITELPEQWCWRPLFSLLGKIPDASFNWVGRATQLVKGYQDHRFCSRCGSATEWMDKVHASYCGQCKVEFFPRLSPCAIMLVTRGDKCLLAKNVNWGDVDWYSALAGFIEPGESVEQTVHREVMEEVGLEVASVEYIGSQPWPFPGQLMLGFLAENKGGDIQLDEEEIAEAAWYQYDQLPPHPDQRTLSGRLIQTFVDRCKRQYG